MIWCRLIMLCFLLFFISCSTQEQDEIIVAKKYLHLILEKKYQEAEKLHVSPNEPWPGSRIQDYKSGTRMIEKYGFPSDTMFHIEKNELDKNCTKVYVIYHIAKSNDDPVKLARMDIYVAKSPTDEKQICYSAFSNIVIGEFEGPPPGYPSNKN